jgi:serine/threonine protein kinase
MGVVYRVRRQSTDTVLALKMILCGRDATFQELARFRIEAEALACLDHPNIIKIRDVGVCAGYPFFALDFAERGSLRQVTRGQPQPPRWSAELVRTLALALQHAHSRGMLHRDLKPANILVREDGTPKVSDFGLVKFAAPLSRVSASCCTLSVSVLDEELNRFARELQAQYQPLPGADSASGDEVIRVTWQQCAKRTGLLGEHPPTAAIGEFLSAAQQQARSPGSLVLPRLEDLTQSGSVLGSPQYMAPEQAAGDLRRIGRHTDVYALGGILYELLVGHPPFRSARRSELLSQVVSQPPPAPREFDPTIPPELEAVCLKCLEKDVGRRYATAAALAEDLQKFLAGCEPGTEEQPLLRRTPDPALGNRQGIISSPAEVRAALEAEPTTRSWWPFRRKSK